MSKDKEDNKDKENSKCDCDNKDCKLIKNSEVTPSECDCGVDICACKDNE
jgi:hypothetical protein